MSTSIALTLDTAAAAVIALVNGQITAETRVYPQYIALNEVTAENVADHVKALTDAAYPNVKCDKRADKKSPEYRAATFQTKVRNGLNRNLPVSEEEKAAKPATLRVSLSGEGGGSSVVDMDSDLGKAILAFLAEGK